MKLTIELDNLTEAQAIAIEDMMAVWRSLGNVGSSRWTKFYADGDGNFHPQITINGERPKFTKLIDDKLRWPHGHSNDYHMDFDWIAWKLRENNENRNNI